MSYRTLSAKWNLRGGVSEVPSLSSPFLLLAQIARHVAASSHSDVWASLCLVLRGFPQGEECHQCVPECGSSCDKSCLTCSGHEPTECLSCDANRRVDESGGCVWSSQCSMDSYVDLNGDCQRCHTQCRRCDGPGKDHCLSCNEPHLLLNATCVKKCPVGYYVEDKVDPACERCHPSCESCFGHHSQHCKTCKPGFFKQASSCVETCSESHFGNKTTMLCERCDPSCNQCVGSGNTYCLNCREGYVFMRPWGQCLKSCPPGYYKDIWSRDCHKCHPTCKTCNGKEKLPWLSDALWFSSLLPVLQEAR
uniref:Growth factor receptor domain-containing protein n=1 Tax=Poecilia mexicana TaxID=48701 RepID=A0A3B3XXL2_9TELE